MTWQRALTMAEARSAVERGELDAAEIAAWPGERLAAENRDLNALTWLAPADGTPAQDGPAPDGLAQDGLAQDGLAQDGPLSGFAAALKANICHLGWRTDCGSRMLAHWHAPYHATVTAHLLAQGARFLGTTNMDEFGMGSSCEHSAWGPARNPWDRTRTPGGSSGGSAAAVAAGLLWYALGSDTGGSVRLPAHCCGLVGLKPTWGGVSRFGLVAFASSLDTVGVLARGVEDARLVHRAMAERDPWDATHRYWDAPPHRTRSETRRRLGFRYWARRRPRVGVPWAFVESHATPGAVREFRRGLDLLQTSGGVISDVGLDLPADPVAVYAVLAAAEASSNLARFDGGFHGQREPGDDYGTMVRASRGAGFGTEVKRRILLGTHVLSADRRREVYDRADRARRAMATAFDGLFQKVNMLALPTAPEAAFGLGTRRDDPLAMHASDVFTVPASLAGLPALTVPTGCDAAGLPLSLQLVGPRGSEEDLLEVGLNLERLAGFRQRKEAPWHRAP